MIAVALGAGCDDDGGPTGPVDMSVAVPHNFDQINTLILQPLCGSFSVCHSKDGAKDAGKLDLTNDPYNALIGVLSDNTQAASEGLLRVKICDPDNSFLWKKLNLPETQKDSMVGYGASMPKDNPHLPPEQLAAIHDWIARGAHLNEPADVTGDTCTTDDAAVPDLASHD
ncbi:MAG TPA: hypothetical protein VH328_15255 [Burkholderiaceae bacterium]|nr:hypothetical protein [Burkholderiaceae bacterium]